MNELESGDRNPKKGKNTGGTESRVGEDGKLKSKKSRKHSRKRVSSRSRSRKRNLSNKNDRNRVLDFVNRRRKSGLENLRSGSKISKRCQRNLELQFSKNLKNLEK